jgi:hypothetical protein
MNSHLTKLCVLSIQVFFVFLIHMLTFHKFLFHVVLLVRFVNCHHFCVFKNLCKVFFKYPSMVYLFIYNFNIDIWLFVLSFIANVALRV